MTRPVLTCRVGDDLNAAARLMWDHDYGVIPVVDTDGRLVGIITDRDACMAAYTQGKRLDEIPVQVMSKQVVTCAPDDSITRAEQLMESHLVRRIPVVDGDGRPVGLLSLNDVARDALQPNAAQRDMLLGFARTLATICRPRTVDRELPRPPEGGEANRQPDGRTDLAVVR